MIAGDSVYIANPNGITAVQLADGSPLWDDRVANEVGLIHPAEKVADRSRAMRTHGVPRFTIQLTDHQLWAKVYRPIVASDAASGESRRMGADQAYVVGLDLSAEGRLLRRWEPSQSEWGAEWTLDGTPVVQGRRMYCSLRRQDAVRSQSHVLCMDLDSGEIVWRTFVSSAESPRSRKGYEFGHHLLTLQHGVLYFNSNLGAIAAIRADEGKILWLCRYPRSDYTVGDPDRADRFLYRDLNPCLVHAGAVLAAPSDCDRIFSLDAATGDLLWSTDGERATDAVHLLGVAQDHLIVSGDYLYWFDVHTGRCLAQFPEPRKEAPGFPLPQPRGFGRGLLVNDEVWFPTRETLLVFPQSPPANPKDAAAPLGFVVPPVHREISLVDRGASGGNLIAGRRMLLIAGARKLYAFSTAP